MNAGQPDGVRSNLETYTFAFSGEIWALVNGTIRSVTKIHESFDPSTCFTHAVSFFPFLWNYADGVTVDLWGQNSKRDTPIVYVISKRQSINRCPHAFPLTHSAVSFDGRWEWFFVHTQREPSSFDRNCSANAPIYEWIAPKISPRINVCFAAPCYRKANPIPAKRKESLK